ncbi:DinB family protein [Pontibacter diazotrophicus]|uniref:DinB family protein n=1 Tax=Pontibacter diazotrophicus TaxID=1400979 RepID=A0A3D8L6N2_9BACT|nr:DinB family protein [Pontibacter diazotrophicus]RDV13059.1 DinB family protein [Pontibacter diazotrophicus]
MNTLESLTRITRSLSQTVSSELASLDLSALNFKAAPDSWSILECLEHLNRYSRYYNPALAKAIEANAAAADDVQSISYSWLGMKSLEMVRPQHAKKHKTVKHMNPNNSSLGPATVKEFLKHQEGLLHLLKRAGKANLHKKAVPVEFFKLLKLRIGEALEFVVLHEERHIQQALRVKTQLAKQAAA